MLYEPDKWLRSDSAFYPDPACGALRDKTAVEAYKANSTFEVYVTSNVKFAL